MSAPIVSVRGLGKMYHLGKGRSHDTLRDQLAHGFRALGRRLGSRREETPDQILWALRDISFEVAQGEVLGVIGPNGAGKSTLLKVLSQITDPTEGEVRIRGRIASLLEVGTGFHPELTGRENIYLNGSILGMSRGEIRGKFDEIVAFSEVERFLDTPVKRYSSGMYVRLAFAVAAHLQPEILVVDEVLAVGDAQFQKKCLGKMEDVSKQGRTVFFVSHNMSAVERLCGRVLLLNTGRLAMDGPAASVVQRHMEQSHGHADGGLAQRTDRQGNGVARAVGFRILNDGEEPETSLQSGRNYIFEIQYESTSEAELINTAVSIDFFDERDTRVLLLRSTFAGQIGRLHPGRGVIRCAVKDLPLANGLYRISLYLSARSDAELLDWIEDAASVTVSGGDFFGTGDQGLPRLCKILVRADWSSG